MPTDEGWSPLGPDTAAAAHTRLGVARDLTDGRAACAAHSRASPVRAGVSKGGPLSSAPSPPLLACPG
jgi:hypothetical protein